MNGKTSILGAHAQSQRDIEADAFLMNAENMLHNAIKLLAKDKEAAFFCSILRATILILRAPSDDAIFQETVDRAQRELILEYRLSAFGEVSHAVNAIREASAKRSDAKLARRLSELAESVSRMSKHSEDSLAGAPKRYLMSDEEKRALRKFCATLMGAEISQAKLDGLAKARLARAKNRLSKGKETLLQKTPEPAFPIKSGTG